MVGLGAIGRAVSRALAEGLPGCRLAGVTSRDEARGKAFLESLPGAPPYFSLPRLVEASDLVVEAATQPHDADDQPLARRVGGA